MGVHEDERNHEPVEDPVLLPCPIALLLSLLLSLEPCSESVVGLYLPLHHVLWLLLPVLAAWCVVVVHLQFIIADFQHTPSALPIDRL